MIDLSQGNRTYVDSERPVPIKAPVIKEFTKEQCPHCGCVGVAILQCEMTFQNQTVIGHYAGCAACTWASPCVIQSRKD